MKRVYIIGAGVIARAHAEAARLYVPDLELHVTDPSATALAAFRAENPGALVADSLDAMLALPARPTDIVIVATPPALHHAHALRAIGSSRHVLCEKPLAMNLGEALQMLAAARSAGVHLGDCSMRFFGYGAGEMLKQVLFESRLGDLYRITCRHLVQRGRSGVEYQPESRWFLDRSKAGGGVLFDWGVYDLSTLFDVLQPDAVRVDQAWVARPRTEIDPPGIDVEHVVGAALSIRLGGRWLPLAYERGSITHGTEVMLMEIDGEDGAATWQWLPWTDDATALTISCDRGGKPVRESRRFPSPGTMNFHHRPLAFFRDAVAGKAGPALMDHRALFNFSVLAAIYGVAAGSPPRTVELGA